MHFALRRPSPFARPVRQAALVLALALLGGCVPGVSTNEDTSSVQGVLKLNFASWEPVATRDVPSPLREQWAAQHPKEDKVMATGDYFGTGSNSYAALITKKDKQGRRVRLVVLKPAESGRFETYILFTESPLDTMPVISTSHANEYEAILGGQSVMIPTEGVIYTRLDGHQKLFFWNEDRFSDIELTDAAPPAAQPDSGQ